MELSRKVYQRLLFHRKSRRSFSATVTVPREAWRGFLEDAMNPIWKTGLQLPAAGGFSDYDILLLAQRLSGIRRGLYHLSAANNFGVRLKRIGSAVDALQKHVCGANQGTVAQATLVIVASGAAYREKYGKRGLELLCQNLGVIQLHFYLTATAWGLGGCAIGWLERSLLGKSFPLQRVDAVVAFTFGL